MKITKNKIRSLIRESIRKFRDPTDDPRFSDPSYVGRPGNYTLTRSDTDDGLIGIRVTIDPVDTVLEFEDHSYDDINEMLFPGEFFCLGGSGSPPEAIIR